MTRPTDYNPRTRSAPSASLIASLVLGLAGPVLGQPRDPAPRTDADGNPLPDGVVARLGSARFRFDGPSYRPVHFSPDGKSCAVGGRRHVSVFDAGTGRRLHLFSLPDEHLTQMVRFTTDGKRLVVGSAAGQAGVLTVYDLANGKAVATSQLAGEKRLRLIDVTPDGSRVLAEDAAGKVYLWDVLAAREVWSIGRTEGESVLPIAADGKWFAVAGAAKAELYDAATGRRIESFPDAGPRFQDRRYAALSPDGRLVVRAQTIDAVAVLKAQGDNRVRVLRAAGGVDRSYSSPDGRYLAGPGPGQTQVWDLMAPDDQGPVARLPVADAAGFSPDGKTLALAGEGVLTLWAVGSWKHVPGATDTPASVYRVRVTPDGKRVIGHTDRGWVAWTAEGGLMTRLSDDTPVTSEAYADVSADGRVAVDTVLDSRSADGKPKGALRVTGLQSGKARLIPYAGFLGRPALTPDGQFVAAFLGKWVVGESVTVWETATGAVVHQTDGRGQQIIFAVAATPDGKGLSRSVAGVFAEGLNVGNRPDYGSVTVTDHRAGPEWKMDPVPWSLVNGGARFSPDGSRLVARGRWQYDTAKDTVAVWDVPTGRRLVARDRQLGRLEAVCLAADNRSLLVGDRSGSLTLIEVATGGDRAEFRHSAQVFSAAFFPDGAKAVSSSPDAPVYVWDLIRSPGPWDPAKADAVWADLASTDAEVAFAAIRKLRANPAEAVAFLKDRLKVPIPPTDETLAGWLKGLDAPAFADRERAERALTESADLIRPKLEAARKGASAEAGSRIDRALNTADTLTPEKLRQVRACEVLEGIRSTEAVALLRAWAAGPAGARLTTEAAESLGRLKP